MDDSPRGLADQWPLLATAAGVVLMGVFILTSTSDPDKGWVFVVFGAAWIAMTVGRTLLDRARGRRD